LSRAKSILLTGVSIAVLGCSVGSRRAEDGEIATWLSADTAAVAGVDLTQVRDGPLSAAIPPEWVTALEPFRQASRAWVAYDGEDMLVIAAGRFPPAPPGAVLIGNGLALIGSPRAIRAAEGQHAIGHTGAGRLMQKAGQLRNVAIWAVIRGNAAVPLHGNGANLERALRFTEYTAASVNWDSGAQVRLWGYCVTAEKAQQLEESLRAMVTLAKRAVHAADLKATLESTQIARQESTVLVSLTARPEALREMLR
jgi:hypothetical protein